ncbi:ComEC/Rec2 family competence protein [Candidatus Saccharibacteria bacterium]|nr:ComEC/Rec2 family competence protein [Candidatus Saccharibacteria bacterium]
MFRLLIGKIHQSYFLVMVCFGVIFGMIFALIFRIGFFSSWLWMLSSILLLVLMYFFPRKIFLGLAFLVGIVISFFRASSEIYGGDYISQFLNQTILVSGVVSGEPETDEKETKMKLSDLKFGEEEILVQGSIFISASRNEGIFRSDRILVSGKLTEGFGIYSGYMYRPKILKIFRPEPGDFSLKIRDWFSERIRGLIPEPEVGLGLSYLLGLKNGLLDEISEELRIVGLVHIVVASGTHLSILVEVARKVFGKISRFSSLLFSELFILFFMAMVGFTPSIMRAGIMSALSLLVGYTGRKFKPWRIISIVMAMTLLIEPMNMINLGWLLSFSAFIGIMVLGPKLSEFFYGDRKPKFIASMIITTVSATLMTLPISLYYFGSISLVSIVANLLILPTLPCVMGAVFFVGVFSGVPIFQDTLSFFATKMLDFHISVVGFFSEMRSFLVEIPTGQSLVFLIYIIPGLMIIIGFLRRKMVKLRKEKLTLSGRENVRT